ncbi:MAG: nitrous oxide reductase family maturation protein NosD [Acidimicrobiia bacterium]|nr:nitrous oxide reductase family maturation protein NosD [Acidimicrobiia bacterium]
MIRPLRACLLACSGVVAVALFSLVGTGARAEPQDLQALIDASEPGATLRLGPGVYAGGVEIDKPLTLVGDDWPVIDVGGEGSGIVVTAPDVTVRGVVVRNTGSNLDAENSALVARDSPRTRIEDNRFEDVLFGIYLRNSPDSVVEGNTIGAKDLFVARRGDGIRLWESSRSRVEENVIDRGRDLVLWFSDSLLIRENEVRDGRYGLHFMYCDGARIVRNRLERNSVGMFLMNSTDLELEGNVIAFNRGPSGYGVGLKDLDGVEAIGNRIVGNRIGLNLENSPVSYDVKAHFERNLFAFNDIAVNFSPSVRNNVFSDNAFIDNREDVGVSSSGQFRGNEWTKGDRGNHWSEYSGFDADGDGIGDIDHRIENLFSHWTDENPNLLFFSETPAARAIDLASDAFPVMRPNPKVVDEAPLTEVPSLTPMEVAAGSSVRSLALVSAALVAVAVLVVISSGAIRPRRARAVRLGGAT